MRYNRLGNSDLVVSEIGFGAWGIGGSKNGDIAYGPLSAVEGEKILRKAIEEGITFFDTADLYGRGESERRIGKAFGSERDRLVVASKVGKLDNVGKTNFEVDHIRSSLEGSLRRLGLDYIDLYQLHSPELEGLYSNREIIEVLSGFKKEGKIREYGLSLNNPVDGIAAIREFDLQVLQVNFNLMDQRAVTDGLIDSCNRNNVGIIARTPLCFGFLTDEINDSSTFGNLDHRNYWPKAQLERWSRGAGLFRKLIKKDSDMTLAQFSLKYCLSYDCVSTAIPGMLTEGEVIENVGVSQLTHLPTTQITAIEKLYQQNNFFLRSNKPEQ